MNLYDAAELRMSVRSFCQEELNTEMLNELDIFIEELQGLQPQIHTNIEIISMTNRKMRPPYYAVLYSEESEGCYINAGFLMQQVVLYLTSRGVGTCYKMIPSGIRNRDNLGRKFMISIAFGLAKEEMYRNPSHAKRLPLERLAVIKAKPTKDMWTLLNIGRLAPSSFNSQPWRFVVTEKKIHIFKRKAGTRMTAHISEIDIGVLIGTIAACAEDLWIDISLAVMSEFEHKAYANNQYIITVKMEG